MILLRRFLVFQAFLLWQGGFLFYAAVVVPVGTNFLQSAALQGMITQRVTHWLNIFGTVWVVLFAWDAFVAIDPSDWQRRLRQSGVGVCLVLLAVLCWLHCELDAHIDFDLERVTDKRSFRNWHIAYLWVSTAHWVIATVLAALTLRAWRAADRTIPATISPTKDQA